MDFSLSYSKYIIVKSNINKKMIYRQKHNLQFIKN